MAPTSTEPAPPEQPSSNQIDRKAIAQALAQRDVTDVGESPFAQLCLFQQMMGRAGSDGELSPRGIINAILDKALLELDKQNKPVWKTVLNCRFRDGMTLHETASSLGFSQGSVSKHQEQAQDFLISVIQQLEERAVQQHQALYSGFLDKHLPNEKTIELVGIEEHVTSLWNTLFESDKQWIVAISGMGGVGKTTLANALLHRVIGTDYSYKIVCIAARQNVFRLGGEITPVEQPALKVDTLVERLRKQMLPDNPIGSGASTDSLMEDLIHQAKSRKHLILIDNLETVTDVEHLLPFLRRLAEPTKIVLTTRVELYSEPNVIPYSLRDLTQEQSIDLLRCFAEAKSLRAILDADDAELAPIYEAFGGNPLVLCTVAAQLGTFSRDHLITDYQQPGAAISEKLYLHIYQKIWGQLTDEQRQVLQAFLLTPETGCASEILEESIALESHVVRGALHHLHILNLVMVHGDINRKRYAVHNLTRTFLQRQVS